MKDTCSTMRTDVMRPNQVQPVLFLAESSGDLWGFSSVIMLLHALT